MKKNVIWALVILNLALLVGAVVQFGNQSAVAQNNPQAPRRPGDYLMVPGTVSSGSTEVVYVVDMTNGLLGGMAYDDSTKRLEAMKKIDLAQIFQAARPPAEPPKRGR